MVSPKCWYVHLFCDVIYGNGKFIAYSGAKTLTSTNGTNWSLASLPVNQNDSTAMAAGDGKFVAVCESSKILYSTNGTVWQCPDHSSTDYFLGGIAYGNGVFCTGSGLVSQDALNWQAANRPSRFFRYSFCCGQVRVGWSGNMDFSRRHELVQSGPKTIDRYLQC